MLLKDEIQVTGKDASRLVAHLPPIADSMNRWAEKKASISLWNALGFSRNNSIPLKIRLLCKFTALFIASRLINVENTQFNDKMDDLCDDVDFLEWESIIKLNLKSVFYATENSISNLSDVITTVSHLLFPGEIDQFPNL